MKKMLLQVQNKEITSRRAYKTLYKSKRNIKNAKFVKMNLKLLNNKGLTLVIKMITVLPIPVFLAKKIFNKQLNELQVQENTKIPKGISIKVETSELTLKLKTI